jgi:hypothetical protein
MIAKAVRYLMFRFGCLAVHLRRPGQIRAAFRQAQSLAGRSVPDGRRALLLPTASPGNLGDAALFIGTVKELRAMGFDRVCVVSFAENQRYEIQGADTVILNLHHNPTGQAYLDFVKLASAFTHFLVWGADIVDGTHGIEVVSNRQTLANLAATMGLHTTICSFSVSPKRSVPAMDGYRRFPVAQPPFQPISRFSCARTMTNPSQFRSLSGPHSSGSLERSFWVSTSTTSFARISTSQNKNSFTPIR